MTEKADVYKVEKRFDSRTMKVVDVLIATGEKVPVTPDAVPEEAAPRDVEANETTNVGDDPLDAEPARKRRIARKKKSS